jgi:hypothetical protein
MIDPALPTAPTNSENPADEVQLDPPSRSTKFQTEPTTGTAMPRVVLEPTTDKLTSATAILSDDFKPRLIVLRGQRANISYPLYAGSNYLGRTDDKPVDIDLDDQEEPDRIWCSRQHATITLENAQLSIEDLNSLNGTFVNRTRVAPGQKRELRDGDVIQIGTVHLKVALS